MKLGWVAEAPGVGKAMLVCVDWSLVLTSRYRVTVGRAYDSWGDGGAILVVLVVS